MRNKLIELRRNNCLTQKEASKLIGISRAHYGRIENGERTPSLNIALKIKTIFNHEGDDIFFNDKCDKMSHYCDLDIGK